MAGIAGINKSGQTELVGRMLDTIRHRGAEGRRVFETDGATFGIVWTKPQEHTVERFEREKAVADHAESGHHGRQHRHGFYPDSPGTRAARRCHVG